MRDFDSLVEEVLKTRPEISRKELDSLIEEKKKTVGGGYLTNQGALFLIAGELQINLRGENSSDLGTKDLYIGANDITILARVLAVYPTNEYNRKDGAKGRYRRVTLFDNDGTARLTLWDDNVELVERLQLSADVPIRVMDGYVRQSLDGRPNLSLGKRGNIEVIKDERLLSKISPAISHAQDLGSVSDAKDIVMAKGTAVTASRTSDFTRNDGTKGTLTQIAVADESGKKRMRVVIWNGTNLPEVKEGQQIMITNLRPRRQPNGELELHGDNGSIISVEGLSIKARPFTLVSVSVSMIGTVVEALALGTDRKVYTLIVKDDALSAAGPLKDGTMVELVPDEETGQTLTCYRRSSIRPLREQLSEPPFLTSMLTKIEAIEKVPGPLMLEVMALSKGSVQDTRLKDGSATRKGELVVGDDTGEVKVIGWKEDAEKLSGIEPGERLRLLGVTLEVSKMGVKMLQLTHLTKIDRVKNMARAKN